ncbi:MAG: hypothetical protein M5R36_06480 [Deltaproteobacteria bacterium]|nr:hypothetical protein [Deltaproteobacteria bacterium]
MGDFIVDSDDNPLLVGRQYEDTTDERVIFYSRESDGEWVAETVYSSTTISSKIALALGPAGKPHVFFYDFDDEAYHYYHKTSDDSWEELVTFNEAFPLWSANDAFVDTDGYSHLLYFGKSLNFDGTVGLLYATNASGEWKSRNVDMDTNIWSASLWEIAPNVFRAAYHRDDAVTEGRGTFMAEFVGGSDMP